MSNSQTQQGPKKRSKLFGCFTLIGIVVAVIIVIAVVVSLAGGGDDSPSSAGTTGQPGAGTTKAADCRKPQTVAVGKAFTLCKHQLGAGWKLSHQEYLGTKVTGTVTNVSKSTSTGIFHIKFLKGSTVVGNMSCTTGDLEPGQSEAVECMNTVTGDTDLRVKGAFTKVTAEATF
jgi:hypothetical protein